MFEQKGFNKLKTVTFGDESVTATVWRRLFLLSRYSGFGLRSPTVHPSAQNAGPFDGDVEFTYTLTLRMGHRMTQRWLCGFIGDIQQTVDADSNPGRIPDAPEIGEGDGAALNDTLTVARYGFKVINVWANDAVSKRDGSVVTHRMSSPSNRATRFPLLKVRSGSPIGYADI